MRLGLRRFKFWRGHLVFLVELVLLVQVRLEVLGSRLHGGVPFSRLVLPVGVGS